MATPSSKSSCVRGAAPQDDPIVHRSISHVFDSANKKTGDWTTIEQTVLSDSNLSAVGFASGLDACIVLNDGTNSVSPRTMATAVEALFAAVYLDGGIEALARVADHSGISHTFLEAVTFSYLNPISDKKSLHSSLC